MKISLIRLSRKTESKRDGTPRLDRAVVSVERVAPVTLELSVVGTSPKRNARLLTKAYSRSAPSLHGHYPLPRYYGLSDSRTQRGYPRFLGSSFPARCPQPPRGVRWLLSPAASPPMAGFIRFVRLATPIWLTRPNRVRFRYGSQVRLARLRAWDCSSPALARLPC